MSRIYTEYNVKKTCYSNLKCYGADGMYNSIVPPTPVTAQPWIFNVLQPHPTHLYKNDKLMMDTKDSCIPYNTLNNLCKL